MREKSLAFVLGRLKYSESSLVLDLFSQSHGRVSCMAKGWLGKAKRAKSLPMQPMHLVEVVLDHRPGRELWHLLDADLWGRAPSWPSSVAKAGVALFVAELLGRTLAPGKPEPELFGFVRDAMELLELVEEGLGNYPVLFVQAYSALLGLRPLGQASAERPYFDAQGGGFAAWPERQSWDARTSQALSLYAESGFAGGMGLRLPAELRRRVLEALLGHLGWHLGWTSPLRSLPVLGQVFG